MTKNIALVITQPPFANTSGQDAVDMAMVLGTFEIPTALFFASGGVRQLASVNTTGTSLKDFTKSFAALPFYDIDDIYASQLDLQRHNINLQELPDFVQVLTPADLSLTLSEYQRVIRF